MISRENIKYYVFLAFISILLFKIIDAPMKFIYSISSFISFFSPFLLGILFALLINPMMMIFEKNLKTHRLLNIIISYILLFILILVGFKLIIPSIIDALNSIIQEIPNYINMLSDFLYKYMSQTKVLEVALPHIQENLNAILKQILDMFSKFSSDLIVYILTIGSVLFNIIMGIILSIYMLYDKEKIGRGLKKILYVLISKNKADETVAFFRMANSVFYNYIIGRILDSLIIGVIAFIGFKFILKIDNVLFLSFIIFLTNIIPYFGPFIGAVPPILMTLVYSPIKSFWVLIFILILQQVDGNIIGPKIMGEQIGLSSLWIISAVLIGGSLFGVLGVFLSVPVAGVIKFSIDKYIDKKIDKKGSN